MFPSFFLFTILSCSNIADAELPSWHNKPIGSHIEPTKVDETFAGTLISPKDFAEKYVRPRKPIVFRNVVKDWPAFNLWTDEYLKEKYGDLELRLEGKEEKGSGIPKGDVCLGRDRMKTFLNQYKIGVDKYVVSELPTPMWHEVNIPPSMSCGDFLESFVEIDLWINSDLGKRGQGGNSIIHKDAFNTINCVVNGSKEWKLIDLKYNDYLYQSWEGPLDAGYGGFSLVNPDKVDAERFPDVEKIPEWQFTTINAGDCLYLPSQMWHQVKSFGMVNKAVAFLFDLFQNTTIDTEKCGEKDATKALSEIDVDLQYPGTGVMYMGHAQLKSVMKDLNKTLVDEKAGYITKERIFKLVISGHESNAQRMEIFVKKAKEMYNHFLTLAGGKKEKMTQEFVNNLTRAQVRPVYLWIFPIEPANSYEHEYAYLQPESIMETIEQLMQQSEGVLKREDFLKEYENIGGTNAFAQDFWVNLAGSIEVEKITDVTKTIEKALTKYILYQREDSDNNESNDDDTITTPQGHVSQPKSKSTGVYGPRKKRVENIVEESTSNQKTEL